MKVTELKINKTERWKIKDFLKEVNECADTAAILRDGYYDDTVTVAAVGILAMEYTMHKAECTFDDYSSRIIK